MRRCPAARVLGPIVRGLTPCCLRLSPYLPYLWRRCDRQGRIVGGIGAVPGFDWWPIKAYRPCPALAQAGVSYTRCGPAVACPAPLRRPAPPQLRQRRAGAARKGQIVDEMLFGKKKERKQ